MLNVKRIVYTSLLATLCSFVILNSVNASNKIGVTQELYIKLSGVWGLCKKCDIKNYNEGSFSWGKAKVENGSIVIDIGSDNSEFFTGPMGGFEITKVYKASDKVIMRILFRNKKEYDIAISITADGSIIFYRMEWYKNILSEPLFGENDGETHPYYKIDGPIIKFYKPNIPNLRMRDNPSSEGKIIRKFNQDEKILVIQKGNVDEVAGIKGYWVKVLTSEDEIGWCFDAYLEEVR